MLVKGVVVRAELIARLAGISCCMFCPFLSLSPTSTLVSTVHLVDLFGFPSFSRLLLPSFVQSFVVQNFVATTLRRSIDNMLAKFIPAILFFALAYVSTVINPKINLADMFIVRQTFMIAARATMATATTGE